MNEKAFTAYIHDLEISSESRRFLARNGLTKLSELFECDLTKLPAAYNVNDDVLNEIKDIMAHADEIKSFFEKRAERIREILPRIQGAPIERLRLSTRAARALKNGGVHTVGKLIQMSQRDILKLRNVGVESGEEIKNAIERVLESGNIVYRKCEDSKEIIIEPAPKSGKMPGLAPENESISLNDIRFSTRARHALVIGKIRTVDELVQMSERDIKSLYGVGTQTCEEILAVIDALIKNGKVDYTRSELDESQEHGEPENEPVEEFAGKGFDFDVIDILTEKFGFKPAKMADWLGLTRQSVYNALEKRLPKRRSVWTGKELSESERSILAEMIENKNFDYTDDEAACCSMNNGQGSFVCLFICENEIKCFFLSDLPEDIREQLAAKKMNICSERELAGESDGEIVKILTKPYFRPNNPEKFRANAQAREMTVDEYALFMSGYHFIDSRNVTDDQIITFMKENMVDGKVYISSDKKNQWIRSIASRSGYSMKDFIELYGFESWLDGSELTPDGAKERHIKELKKYIVHDNAVYFPSDSNIYRVLQTYAGKYGTSIDDYVRSLGFERTARRSNTAVDTLERDMEIRQGSDALEYVIFNKYPLLGSCVLPPEILEKLNKAVRGYIDSVLQYSGTKLTLKAKMQITIALINYAKHWDGEEDSSFWKYIVLQFGYRDTKGAVTRILQSALMDSMKHNGRLFLEDANGRAFKATAVIHALSPRKSWMALFDFLFDFYKSNLNWRAIPNDPLVSVMICALQQKLSGGNDGDIELTISSKAYEFREGIRKLIIYRPVFTRNLFEKLISKIDSLVNSESSKAVTYEELLCEDWFKDKIIAIANTKKAERHKQAAQRDVAIDYDRIRAKYILKNETDVQLVLPDIRLKNKDVTKAALFVSCNGREIIRQSLSWYGNELGKTLSGAAVSISAGLQDRTLNIRAQIKCDDEIIYDSEESLYRNELIFYGSSEASASQVKRDHYTLAVPEAADVETENVDAAEIDLMNNHGLKAFFIEMKDGYILSVNGKPIAFDDENGTDIKVITPGKSDSLPAVTLPDGEAFLAYRKSACSIILGNKDNMQQFILRKNGENVELASLERSDNGLAFVLPLDGEDDVIWLQIINLANEKLIFDRKFMLISEASCHFNREFYYAASDYDGAEYCVNIDGFHETVPFGKDEAEVRVPFRGGELHMDIPKITVEETSGEWLQEQRPAWFIGNIPQDSFFKVNVPAKVSTRFLVGGKDIMYDGQGLVTIGNVLQSFGGAGSLTAADVVMKACGQKQSASYPLALVYFKERFLKCPSFRTEEQRLFWDCGGEFIGNANREFTLLLSGVDDRTFEFKLREDTEYIDLPEDMPIGNYRFEISIQVGGLFKSTKSILKEGDCVVGDKNLLRFMNRRIVIDSVTDESKEETGHGHIKIDTCYIDQIRYCGMEDTSEGYCPVYSGVLYSNGYHGERYEFSFDEHINKRGIEKMKVNPVRIVYISSTELCITDSDRDGLYYYSYRSRETGNMIFALTDRECTDANRRWYSNADLYLYRTEECKHV